MKLKMYEVISEFPCRVMIDEIMWMGKTMQEAIMKALISLRIVPILLLRLPKRLARRIASDTLFRHYTQKSTKWWDVIEVLDEED